MSVRTEINRISGAKDAIVASIGNKGVSVPSGTKIDGLSQYVDVIATPKLQSKTVSPSTSSQTVKPDNSYNGLSQVTVNAMPSGSCTVAGGGLTASGGSVSATGTKINLAEKADTSDGGYYVKVTGSGTVLRAAITNTRTAGYIDEGTTTVSGTTSLSSNTATKYYKIATSIKTVTPGAEGTTVWPDDGTLLASVSVRGDSNLIPAKIKKGETIFGVTGEYEGEGGSLGTDTCTVRLYVGTQAYWHPEDRVNVFYKAYENGRWRVKYIETDATASNYVTLNNIICGSEFFVYTEMCSYIDPGECELFSDEYRHCLICPNAKGQTITINMWEAS